MNQQIENSWRHHLEQVCVSHKLPCADVEAGNHLTSVAGFQWNDAPTRTDECQLAAGRHYLVASITKPIVATAVLKLVSEGKLCLTQRIRELLPQFDKSSFRRITLRHLLTHTSGLPDMLPNNAELRASHASLQEFLQHATAVDPEFAPGTNCQYSSVGFLLLGAVIESVCGQSLPEFLQAQFFLPLDMHDTWLGVPAHKADRLLPQIMLSQLPDWQSDAEDWGWNSRYWRTLGAPWGGLISTAADLGRFARGMLQAFCGHGSSTPIPASAARAAMQNQTQHFAEIPRQIRESRPWGFGWRHSWPAHQATFSDLDSNSDIFGHWGATGTMFWIDTARLQYAVFLTSVPYEESRIAIQKMSNVAGSYSDLLRPAES